jgi:hypothetical protein
VTLGSLSGVIGFTAIGRVVRPRILALILAAAFSGARPASLLAEPPSTAPLSDYAGTYANDPARLNVPRSTLEIVAGDELFAVIDEAKYRLQRSGTDEFTNLGGKKIPFRRDASGKVIGFEESGTFHSRLSPNVTAASAALARPRPPGEDLPRDYRYHSPADLGDGIAVGDIAQSGLGRAVGS